MDKKQRIKDLDKLGIACQALKVAAECLSQTKCLNREVAHAFEVITRNVTEKAIFLGAPLN